MQRKKDSGDIIPYDGKQYFQRIPNVQEIEKNYKREKRANQKGLCVALVATLIGYGLSYCFTEHTIIGGIIITIVGGISMEYFHLGIGNAEEAYKLMTENEILSMEQLTEL